MDIVWHATYIGDFAKDTMFLSTEEVGAYCLLENAYYISGGPISSDRRKIAKIIKTSPQKAKKILEELSCFFEEKDGLLVNKRIDIELDKLLKKRETAIANGRAGGRASAKAKASPSHIHSQNNNKRESRKVDSGFYPNQETQEFLRFRNISFDKNNVDAFIQYYTAKGNQCSDWQAKFNQWMLKEKTFNKTGGNSEARKISSAKILGESCGAAFEDS